MATRSRRAHDDDSSDQEDETQFNADGEHESLFNRLAQEEDEDAGGSGDAQSQSLNYFLSHNIRVKTSTRTLADYELPSGTEIREALSSLSDHKEEKKRLAAKIEREDFQKWYDAIEGGFNVLLYGFGSKKRILDNFRQKYLNDCHHFVIYGFFTEIGLRNVSI